VDTVEYGKDLTAFTVEFRIRSKSAIELGV
jgi:hypothetical protein